MHRKLLVMAIIGAAFSHTAAAQPAAPSTDAVPGKIAPETSLSKQKGDLSDKLNKSNGVIRPEGGVDPAMQKPAPATGPMPVIPPPGSPGGAKDVQPK